ncbi:MAG: LysR family transcriptional regulator [Myxococcota bacterium]
MNWDHLRTFLALSQHGSAQVAGQALGVNRTTVTRRIQQLQTDMGLTLITRTDSGWEATADGEALLELATQFAEELAQLNRQATASNEELAGPVRLSLPQPLLSVVMPSLRNLSARYPDIDIELEEQSILDPGVSEEVDLALRIANTQNPELPPDLHGRRIGPVQLGFYAHKDAIPSDHAGELDWISLDEELAHLTVAQWLSRVVQSERVRLRVNSAQAMLEAIQYGFGVGILPCFLGDSLPDVIRLGEPQDIHAELWLLIHPHLRRSARVLTVYEELSQLLLEQRPLFLGAQPQSEPINTPLLHVETH